MEALLEGASGVFISYRRNDIPLLADLLAEKLRSRSVPVFLDVDAIDLGYDWRLPASVRHTDPLSTEWRQIANLRWQDFCQCDHCLS